MSLKIFIFFTLLLQNFSIAQSTTRAEHSYQIRELLHDAGECWSTLSVLGQFGLKNHFQKKTNAKTFDRYEGMIFINNGTHRQSIHGKFNLIFKENYFTYFNPSYQNISNLSGNLKVTDSKIFDNKKTYSGIGFENDWAIIQIGKGSESWGSGENIELALSSSSEVYGYFLLGSNYGNLRVKYIHGSLGNIDKNIRRYITARGIEWTNKRSFILGFSETVIYSGENRAIDIGYLNPVSSHLEIELNNRLNIVGDGNANAVWQIHLDYLLKKRYRFSFNYLLDEFVLDPDIEIGKEHGKAFSLRLSYAPIFNDKQILTLFSTLVYVGTPTFRHRSGGNNFITYQKPLGWYRGSDGRELIIGLNYSYKKNVLVSSSIGAFESGEESTTNRVFDPYKDYQREKFPSGKINYGVYLINSIKYSNSKGYSISLKSYWSQNNMINVILGAPIYPNVK